MNSPRDPWKHFQQFFFEVPELAFHIDLSRMFLEENVFTSLEPRWRTAWEEMRALEAGAVANPDEKRMVGHYWLRDPDLAPTREVKREIVETLASVKQFASAVHRGEITGARGPFTKILLIGIGGSCLGPQFVSDALGHPLTDKLDLFSLDNTDPDGMDRTLSRMVTMLGETLCVVVSKSGATKETRNGMVEVAQAYERANLIFAEHAVAVTGRGSQLDLLAANWLARFPMWDWIGGRTSELSAVGLLPAALQGLDFESILAGAKAMDHLSRAPNLQGNPAGLLALAWLRSGNDNVPKNMVILPYKDRLVLFSRYLQQLVMESLGKELNRDGKKVEQGITVYGNKGSTDQHAYVQQLRDGPDDFFVTFIEVDKDRGSEAVPVEEEFNSGDYLHGFLHGTRKALSDKGRKSILIGLPEVNAYTVGMLIALFERAVGYYASFQNLNAYHQPGVEAGKKAAEQILHLQLKVKQLLKDGEGSFCAEAIAKKLTGATVEEVYWICRRLAAQKILKMESGSDRFAARFSYR